MQVSSSAYRKMLSMSSPLARWLKACDKEAQKHAGVVRWTECHQQLRCMGGIRTGALYLMIDFTQIPQRSILYYPTITVPNGVWLRRALLYWDRVASIVPQENYESFTRDAYTSEIEFLSSEGAFREVYPEALFYGSPDRTQKLIDEVKDAV